jgi:hypothetical protein
MWKIIEIEYRLNDNVAINVTSEFRLVDGNTISRNIINVELPEPTNNVIPFNELTEEQVIQWVKDNYDYLTVESNVQTELDRLVIERNNKITDTKLPWRDGI